MFGSSAVGAGVGRWLGQGIGSIFGSGDYSTVGQPTNYNVLTNGKQIPQFSTTHQTNIVCHREYLGDIQGTTAFSNTVYPLNPGIASTFPWLSTIAENYQEYKFHGIIFEFRPLITDFVTSGAPGVIVMATNYNADVPQYVNKQQMENSEYAVSVKPTSNLIHGIECETSQTILPQRYIRSGAVPSGQDLRLYDTGNFQFATQSNPNQNLGELWVSYCVEFFKPVLPVTSGGNIISAHVQRTGTNSTTSPLGTTTIGAFGTLGLIVSNFSVAFSAINTTLYLVELVWSGTTTLVIAPNLSQTGLSFQGLFNGDTDIAVFAPVNSATTSRYICSFIVKATTSGPVSFTLGNGGTVPSTGNLDIFVTEIDSTITQ